MRTNKRTVWFLTVLSLVAVLSIYTLNKKNPLPFDGITIFGDDQIPTSANKDEKSDAQQSVFAESYLFEEMRMEVRNERSQLQEQLTKKMNSADNAEEMNEAYDEMEKLVKQQSTENLLEMQVKSLGYADAFVRSESGNVTVTVLSEDGHSSAQAQEITHLIMSNWEDAKKVKVDFKGDS
ncbi:MAG TPA: SpoIIIAH-like family protein [Sporosarcina sp.]|nr:SpoIIIAH-like family protein [Sporosarcina sp.]